MDKWQPLAAALDDRRRQALYRQRKISDSPSSPKMMISGKPCLCFCSNDYLGLANHPAVIKAFKKASDHYGVGSGAAHLINGHAHAHHALEEELADFTGRQRALLFSTGYMANLGVINTLCGTGDHLYQDRLNHASLLDAGKLSGARQQRYSHLDSKNLLAKCTANTPKMIATDAVFSMDGDLAELPQLAQIAQQHDAWLMVDDAHGLGVLGHNGAGTLSHFGLDAKQAPILMGTLGKGLGTFGAFVAGDELLIEALIQQARSYIYTTAMPAAIAEATRTSLTLLQTESWRREKLQQLISNFKTGAAQLGLPLMPSDTPIQPLLIGDSAQATAVSQQLLASGILVTAIRPPTVPANSARLRITLSANHTEQQVAQLLTALERLL
ncbi:MAG: 8-amino-7-oxononanoate synthase [Gammaproteobacteria bacterium]|nr:8-amino-7-oxononanoate synthase [Gammaproteobacteria bacterium]